MCPIVDLPIALTVSCLPSAAATFLIGANPRFPTALHNPLWTVINPSLTAVAVNVCTLK